MKCRAFFAIVLWLPLAAWASGCSGGEPTAIAPREELSLTQEQRARPLELKETTMPPIPTPEPSAPTPPPAAEQVVRLAVEDLAQRLSLSSEETIRLVSVEAVDWPDASLGCPQPGMMYAQVITPGFRVVLEAEGKEYAYHTDAGRFVVLCEKGGEAGGPTQEEAVTGEPNTPNAQSTPYSLAGESTETVKFAKDDLARRLGIGTEVIDVVAVIGQEFSADAFYCRVTKARIARDESPATISGETILLSAAGQKYEYHASDETVIFCRQLP